MVDFINSSGIIGQSIEAFTLGTTGDFFLTALLILVLFIFISIAFRLPLEIGLALSLPFVIITVSAYSSFWAVGGIIFIYLGVIFAKKFFIN